MSRQKQVIELAPEDVLLTPAEAAKMMRVEPVTVTRWCTSGKLEFGRDWVRTPGGHRRIRQVSVLRITDGNV